MSGDTLGELEARLGCTFAEPHLLELALTHPSYAAEQSDVTPHNQRLEFLGDAVLQLVMTDALYQRYPDLPEGDLTKLRAILTRKPTLAVFARSLGLGTWLRLGRGETSTGGRQRNSNLCDAFEAVLGAMYLDPAIGLPHVRRLLQALRTEHFADVQALLKADNPKGVLQERLQQDGQERPAYRLVDESGPDHEKRFTVAVFCGTDCLGEGQGRKRQAAEQAAARQALETLTAGGAGNGEESG